MTLLCWSKTHTLKKTAGMEGALVITWAIPSTLQMQSLRNTEELSTQAGARKHPLDHKSCVPSLQYTQISAASVMSSFSECHTAPLYALLLSIPVSGKIVKDFDVGKKLLGVLFIYLSSLSLPFNVFQLFYDSKSCRKLIIMQITFVHKNANYLCLAECN